MYFMSQKGGKMIYTITFNPAIDYVIKIENFIPGKINKSKEEYIFPGGKGINVSIVLKTLGQEATAMGFIAGFVGKEIEEQVQKYGVKTDFIKIENSNITLIALKKSIDNKKYIIRLLNNQMNSDKAILKVGEKSIHLSFGRYEVKTVIYDNNNLYESNVLEIQ